MGAELLIPIIAICIPIVAIVTGHQRKVLEMKLQSSQGQSNRNQSDIEALRQEIRALRDTTMQYDISFDTALQRMEMRVEHIERRAKYTEDNDAVTVVNGR